MIRKKLYALSFLSILLIVLILQNVPQGIGLTETKNDPVNDVYYFPHNSILPTGKGDYVDGIDIIRLDLDGQYVNVTFEGSLEAISVADEWLQCSIFFFETYDPLISNFDQWQYSVTYKSIHPTEPYYVYFIHYIPNSGYTSDYWNGSGWSSSGLDGVSIGNVTGNLLTAEIPPLAFTVLDNVTYFVESQWGNFLDPKYNTSWHVDYCPDEFSDYLEAFDGDGGDDAIPGYDMFIFIGTIIGISIILLKKRSK